jgi:hypothetical protein
MNSATLQTNRFLRLLPRALATLLLLIILLGIFAFFLIDSLAVLIARPILAPYGIALQQVEGLQIERHRVRLQRLGFQLDGASEASQIEQLELHFSDGGWFAMPLQRVHAEHIEIALAESAQRRTADSYGELPTLPRLEAIQQVMQSLPEDAVEITRLDIAPFINSGRLNVRRQGNEVQVQIAAQETQLSFNANWHESDSNANSPVSTQTLRSGEQTPKTVTGELRISALGAELLSTQFALSEADSLLQFDASSEIQLQPVSAYAQDIDLLPDVFTGLEGALSTTWHVAEGVAGRSLTFSIAINPNSRVLSHFNPTLSADLHQGVWQNPQTVEVHGSYQPGTRDLDLHLQAPESTLALSLGQAEPARLAIAVDALDALCDIDLKCLLTQATRVQFPELIWRDNRLQDLLLISNGTFGFEQGRYTLQFAQGSRLELGAVENPIGQLTQVNLLVQQALDLALDENGRLSLSSQGIDFYLPNILIDGKNSHVVSAISGLSLSRSDGDLQFQAHAQLRNLGSDWLPFILRKPELDIDIANRNSSLELAGLLRVADRDLLQIDSTFNTENLVGELHAETPTLEFESGSQSLSQWFFQAPFTADLIAGTLQGGADLSLETDDDGQWLFNGPLNLTLDKLSGFFQETAFIGLSTQLGGQMQNSTDFKSDSPHSFDLKSVDPGLPIEDIHFLYDIDTRESFVNVTNFNARLFGGQAHSDGVRFDWSAPSNQITLELERIDLASMLSLAAYDSIRATGLVSGTIPIRLTGSSPTVEAGNLQVEAPGGAIRYSPSSGSSSGNATLDFVNQALSNYQYDLMETAVEYLPTGELELGVRLQGHNPDMNNGQRINLNLNISDNIPALLRSLQSGRSIADALERELQSR